MRRSLNWAAGVYAVMLLTIPFALLPLHIAVRCGDLLGRFMYMILKKWRYLGYENIERMLPWMMKHPAWEAPYLDADSLTRDLFRNTGKLVAELGRLYHGLDAALMATVDIRGMEHYHAAESRGRGILFITAHCGNWELMAQTFGARHKPVAVVAKPMKKKYVDRLLEKMRYRNGNSVIYRDNAVREILSTLKANGIVGILVDQVAPPPHGTLASFMGSPAWTTRMPVRVAMKSGAALLPIFIHREGDRNIVTIQPEMHVSSQGTEEQRIQKDTERLNRYIEEQIVRYPDQWNWLYRRWKGVDGGMPVPSGD